MSEIKISIILPSYNSEKHIKKAIDGFLDQDYTQKELIIVDGKSTDLTPTIIDSYVTKYDNIFWIKEKDTNVTDAINIGIKHCTGDFIAFLAADVFYYTNDIFSTINRNYKMIPFDGIYFDYYCYYPKRKEVILNKSPNVQFNKNNLLRYGTLAGFDNIFISKVIYVEDQYNPDYNLCSDWELFLRISQKDLLFLYVEKICTINVQDGDNLSLKYQQEQTRQIKEVARIYNTENVVPFFENRTKISIKRKVKGILKRMLAGR